MCNILILKGSIGNEFYIILRGSIGVYVTTFTNFGQELKEVAVLQQGASFGELALLYDTPRTATIICKEDCDFALLKRDDFHDIIGKFL